MKKLIITLIILVVWTSKGISQNSNDSVTCIPNSQLSRAITIIENGKVVKQELELTKERSVWLEYRISTKDSIISQYQQKEDNWKKIDANYKSRINNYQQYTKNAQSIFEEQRKQIRGLKFKKWLGILAGFGIGYVIAK
jgi:predicted HNH restriction endonuclease